MLQARVIKQYNAPGISQKQTDNCTPVDQRGYMHSIMYLVRAPCKKTDRSVGMSLDKYEYIIIIIIIINNNNNVLWDSRLHIYMYSDTNISA